MPLLSHIIESPDNWGNPGVFFKTDKVTKKDKGGLNMNMNMNISEQKLYSMETFDITNLLSKKSMLTVFEKTGIEVDKKLKMAVGKKERCASCIDKDDCEDPGKFSNNLDVIKSRIPHTLVGPFKTLLIRTVLEEKKLWSCDICKSQ